MPHKFSHENLPITRQQDSHSCLIFAANAAGHFILPTQMPLLQAKAAAKERSVFESYEATLPSSLKASAKTSQPQPLVTVLFALQATLLIVVHLYSSPTSSIFLSRIPISLTAHNWATAMLLQLLQKNSLTLSHKGCVFLDGVVERGM